MTDGGCTCRFLPWDSTFFERRIGRFDGTVLDDASWAKARAWCLSNDIDCLYVAVPVHGLLTHRMLGEPGVRLVDVRVVLVRERPPVVATPASNPQSVVLRTGKSQDIPILRAIAARAHTKSRFFQDPGLAHRAAALFEHWLERSFEDLADVVWIAEREGLPVGYVTCSCRAGDGGIGLVGLGESARGQGIGRMMLEAALGWLDEHGAKATKVTTQATSLEAQRLYLRTGFLPTSVDLWLHCWRTSS